MPLDHDAAAVAFDRLVRECSAGISMQPRFRPEREAWSSLSPEQRRARDRERKAKSRAAETPEQREARLAWQREYELQSRCR